MPQPTFPLHMLKPGILVTLVSVGEEYRRYPVADMAGDTFIVMDNGRAAPKAAVNIMNGVTLEGPLAQSCLWIQGDLQMPRINLRNATMAMALEWYREAYLSDAMAAYKRALGDCAAQLGSFVYNCERDEFEVIAKKQLGITRDPRTIHVSKVEAPPANDLIHTWAQVSDTVFKCTKCGLERKVAAKPVSP